MGEIYWICDACDAGIWLSATTPACLICNHLRCRSCCSFPEHKEIKSTQTKFALDDNISPEDNKPKIDLEEFDETRRSSLEIENKMHALELKDAQGTKGTTSPKPLNRLRASDIDLRASDPSLSSSLFTPLLDPVGHYEKLRNLEEQVVDECRLQEYTHDGAIVSMESRAYNLETCVEDFQGLLRAIDLLTKDGFCEDYITILVQTSTDRPKVAEAIESDVKKLRELINGILKHASDLHAFADEDNAPALDATTQLWCYKIISHLNALLLSGVKDEGDESDDSYTSSEPEHYKFFPIFEDFRKREGASPGKTPSCGNTDAIESFLYCCKCFHSVLALAFSSYAGSHLSNFSQILQSPGHESFLINRNLTFRQQPLACLQGYLGGPAWIFGFPHSFDGEFQVAICVKAFADLWGPVWIVPAESPGHIRHICTERGFLQQTSLRGEAHGTEIPCHWFAARTGFNGTMVPESQELFKPSTSNTLLEAPNSAASFSPPIPENSRLLIGAPTINSQAPHGMTVHGSCRPDIRKKFDFNTLQLAGTMEETYVNDSYSFSIVGGKYVTIGASMTRKRIPATKYKDQLMEWLSKPNTKEHMVPLLKIHAGLEVSICTGNARRITLWEALRLASTLKRSLGPSESADSTDIACAHHVGDTNCLMNCWNSRSSSSIDIGEWERDGYWRTVADALVLLNHTGVVSQGSLRAYWPYRSVPHTYLIKLDCLETKNYWIPMVSDSPFTATFATMTPRCLRYRARDVMAKEKIYANECSSTQDTTPARTALQTRIHLSSRILKSASMTRPIKAKRTHSMDKKAVNWTQNENTLKSTTHIKCKESLEGCIAYLQGKGTLSIRSDDNPRLAKFNGKALFSPKPFQKQGEFQSNELMYEDHWEEPEAISVLVI